MMTPRSDLAYPKESTKIRTLRVRMEAARPMQSASIMRRLATLLNSGMLISKEVRPFHLWLAFDSEKLW
jgi:hypothetical protein